MTDPTPNCAGKMSTMFTNLEVDKLVRRAKAVCADCPLKRPCLNGAMERGERFGVWGGTTPKERAAMRQSPLSPEQVTAIRADARPGIVVARAYGVTPAAVSRIRSRVTWRWLD